VVPAVPVVAQEAPVAELAVVPAAVLAVPEAAAAANIRHD